MVLAGISGIFQSLEADYLALTTFIRKLQGEKSNKDKSIAQAEIDVLGTFV
ncbi:MAG: hypothetical protein KME19_16550 [Microcoleus vaginatus WJT46-NPBG5]|jgi:hypothetical protein|nr:hypothetical protein [Microcoleus vaginatus WJT46-NPBG5]